MSSPSKATSLVDQLDADSQVTLPTEAVSEIDPPVKFQCYTLAELLQRPIKEWLVKGLLGRRDLCMIVGSAKSGKSFLVIELIGTLISGDPKFADRFEAAGPVNVVYAAGEGQSGLVSRFFVMADKHHIEFDTDRLRVIERVPQLFQTDPSISMAAFVEEFLRLHGDFLRNGLLVIDTFGTATLDADENKAGDVAKILAALSLVRDALGCTILVVHHVKKSSDQPEIRGSSAIAAGFDSVMFVEKRSGSTRRFGCKISKDAPDTEPVAFEIQPFVKVDKDGRKHDSAVVSWGVDSPEESSAPAMLKGRVLDLLRSKARSRESAMPVAVIAREIGDVNSERSVRELLKNLARLPSSGVKYFQAKSTCRNGHPNRNAYHFYFAQPADKGAEQM